MDLDPRTQSRLDRIKAEVDILSLLEGFGFHVRGDMDREQQFPCKLHGDGSDMKPSARVYPETHSWYCWGCQKSRDAVSTVREAMNLGFIEAIKWLEDRHNLPALPYVPVERPKGADQVVAEALLRPDKSFEDDAKRVHTLLDALTEERDLPLERATAFWDAYDRIVYMVTGKGQHLPEAKGRVGLERIRTRILEEVRGD